MCNYLFLSFFFLSFILFDGRQLITELVSLLWRGDIDRNELNASWNWGLLRYAMKNGYTKVKERRNIAYRRKVKPALLHPGSSYVDGRNFSVSRPWSQMHLPCILRVHFFALRRGADTVFPDQPDQPTEQVPLFISVMNSESDQK